MAPELQLTPDWTVRAPEVELTPDWTVRAPEVELTPERTAKRRNFYVNFFPSRHKLPEDGPLPII